MGGVRYLLIDAYNVICATSHLRKIMQGNIDLARDKLAKFAREIHDAEGVRVALILDSKSEKLQIEYPYESKRFEFIYAPTALTADGVIERIVSRVKQPELVSVVSNDNMVREAIRSSGAIALRPEDFFDWSRASALQLNQIVNSRSRSNDKNFENRLQFDLDI